MVREDAAGYESTGDAILDRAMRLHAAIKRSRPDAWRGVQTRELTIKQAMFNILEDVNEVERLFLVVKQRREY